MASFLILYSTTDGHTVEICRRLQHVIEAHGHRADVAPIAAASSPDWDAYDQIVIGASIRYGRHHSRVEAFIRKFQPVLERKPNAFFSVNVVARKPEKSHPYTNPYLRKFLRKIAWKPQRLAVFAGRIDYPKCGPVDRTLIRLIMWMTRGPTDPTGVYEFTDWGQVEAFGRSLCD